MDKSFLNHLFASCDEKTKSVDKGGAVDVIYAMTRPSVPPPVVSLYPVRHCTLD